MRRVRNENRLLERYAGKDTKPLQQYLSMRAEEPSSAFALGEITTVAVDSVLFDKIMPTKDLFTFVYFERMDMALTIYCELCDLDGMGYTHRKALDFLPAALRAKVDGIPWTPPPAEEGWFADAGSYVPGTDVKLG